MDLGTVSPWLSEIEKSKIFTTWGGEPLKRRRSQSKRNYWVDGREISKITLDK